MHKHVRKFWMGVGLVAGLTAMVPVADAHGIWFAQRARQLALIYGVGADDLDAVKRLPLINAVKGFDAQGLPVKVSAHGGRHSGGGQ
jgi:hypothetical protein